MAEVKNVAVEDKQPNTPAEEKPSFGAKAKEWFRKKIVSLKRNPQRIALVYQVVVSFIWLIILFTFSQAAYYMSAQWTGIILFANTLLSILVLALFLNTFPKRKPVNKVFLAFLFVFLLGIILCDVLYYLQVTDYIAAGGVNEEFLARYPVNKSLNWAIVHIILEGVSILLIATLPLYSKLIMKINTRKVLEENQLSEDIDTSEEV